MARPFNTWAHEPYHKSGHASSYPQERPSPGLRLPPPSSLATGGQPAQGFSRAGEITGKQGSLPDPYMADSPSHHIQNQLPTPTSEPYILANSVTHHREDMPRLPPAYSSTTSNPPEDMQDPLGLLQLARGQRKTQLPRLQPPRHQLTGPQTESLRPYSQVQTVRPPQPYSSRDSRLETSPRSIASPETPWTPRLESKPSERVKISDLLSSEPRRESLSASKAPAAPAALVASPTSSLARPYYRINVRQQPAAARSCGFGERDRRVIDPPPIVQLKIDDPNASPEEVNERLKWPNTVLHCTIWNETGDQDCSSMPEDYRQQRRLMGNLVATPFNGADENGEEGCFFCFPDLSCRTPGSFRLRFSLVVLDPTRLKKGDRTPVCAQAMSDVFTVYNAKDFPGMQASTALTKKLKEQGCLISIKKGNEKTSSSHARDESDDDYDDHDDGGSSGGRRKRKTRS
ncbi:velvet factor-domain-containing protein [Xylariales sp. AK1849]|nr:velvet factor-domain-containing protein [Xylariales sp. AK1849]